MRKCKWCLSPAHTTARCPSIPRPPIDTEKERWDLAERVHRWRLFAGQCCRICREHGLEIPAAILAMQPDQPEQLDQETR